MHNPKWRRDEIILALDLYFSPDRGSIDKKNRFIIELSKILNSLPLAIDRSNVENFRSPDAVVFKLSNFVAIDESRAAKGYDHGSKLDRQLFHEYQDKHSLLSFLSKEIRSIAADDTLKKEIARIEEDDLTEGDTVLEGGIIFKLHKLRERDSKIVRRKKEQVLSRQGKLACEVCTFTFEEFYGNLGTGFIECHHRVPLAKLTAEKKTTLEDLALVCSNCHRMIHKKIDTLSLEDLKILIKSNG